MPENGLVFQNLIENYLFKYELNIHKPNSNSSLVCGKCVNLLLSKSQN